VSKNKPLFFINFSVSAIPFQQQKTDTSFACERKIQCWVIRDENGYLFHEAKQ
jgi:hypothetical protein